MSRGAKDASPLLITGRASLHEHIEFWGSQCIQSLSRSRRQASLNTPEIALFKTSKKRAIPGFFQERATLKQKREKRSPKLLSGAGDEVAFFGLGHQGGSIIGTLTGGLAVPRQGLIPHRDSWTRGGRMILD